MDEDNETADELRDVLRRNGFVRCDIAACNCGGWHARYGLPERWDEVKDALAQAGHPLCNKNGNLVRYALKQSDRRTRQAPRLDAQRDICGKVTNNRDMRLSHNPGVQADYTVFCYSISSTAIFHANRPLFAFPAAGFAASA
jgi:hypothetical protein